MRRDGVSPIVPIERSDPPHLLKAVLELNNANAQDLSWLDPGRLDALLGDAVLSLRIGEVEAVLMAFDQEAAYDSPNFLWFRARYARFLYVDRIVVAPSSRGRGHARRLYDDLFAFASDAGHERIVCEVNLSPPNPASDAFHAALGFEEVGQASIHGGAKSVRYFSRAVSRAG